MSLILEALKRAEAQRGPGDPMPVRYGTEGSAQGKRRNRAWMWGLAVVAVNAALLAVFFRPGKEVPKSIEPMVPSPLPSVTVAPAPAVISPPTVSVPVPAPVVVPIPASRVAPVAPKLVAERLLAPPGPAVLEKAPPPAPSVAEKPEPSPVKVAQPAPEPAVAPAAREDQPQADALRKLKETLDKVNVSAHVYAEEPSQRFVFVNGKVYREGERVTPEGFRIEAITADGLLVEKDGVRLKVPAGR